MMLKKWALAVVKPSLETWLQRRALALPLEKQQQLAAEIGKATGGRVSTADALMAIQLAQTELQNLAISSIDRL
ncbi:MAG TPA: hypothetical protein VFA07_04660 [Chthonomonadaceae bacterium]|nr:hypothetical protein [Chthonomonadaceae bacterium]